VELTDIIRATADFIADSPLNRIEELGGLSLMDPPLAAVAAADDPLFEGLKDPAIVGPRHMAPGEWLDGSRAVVSLFLPFSARVRRSNSGPGLPSPEWLYGRIEGEDLVQAALERLVEYFAEAGYRALAPAADKRFRVIDRRSNWSERHVAFIAGLGTFSLSRALITKAGSAGRLGSVIVDAGLEPTPRYYEGREENCSGCKACIARCPPCAIREKGKDNAICGGYLDGVKARFAPRYGCGKCQTGVPCEAGIPAKRAVSGGA
jgi:epoxyqueuosine reductase